jgi:hypothetical protein
MSHQVRRLGTIIVATALVLLVALGTAGTAPGKKGKRLRLTCDQARDAIERTAQQFKARYVAMGWPIGSSLDPTSDGISVGEACKYLGGKSRQGGAFMSAERARGEPLFPGEGDDRVIRYLWSWTEVVTRTKKGRIRTTVPDFKCHEKVAVLRFSPDPVAFPCGSSIPPDPPEPT